jgi:diguanylate cyclase (GGDEF)-like protein
LPTGFVILNALILGFTQSRWSNDWSRSRLVTAHAAAALAGASVYTAAIQGPGELTPLMYLTVVLVAMPRLGPARLRRVSLAALSAYAVALLLRAWAAPNSGPSWPQIVELAGTAICFVLVNFCARRFAHRQLQARRAVVRLQAALHKAQREGGARETLNRSFRRQHVAALLEKGKALADRTRTPFSICMLDLDHFSRFQQSLAPADTERLRGSLADRASRILRASDTVSRTRYRRSMGRECEDEFLAILPDTPLAQARVCAERIAVMSPPGLIVDQPPLTLAAGVAEYRPGESIRSLLVRADQALHAAQHGGPGAVKSEVMEQRSKRLTRKPNLRLVR